MYKYEGKPLIIGSRAMDDAGRMQPTIEEEVSVMGVESVYHRNSIATWEVTEKGEVHNVQIRS
jgi:sulfane dehydrogenase subunit SoxC